MATTPQHARSDHPARERDDAPAEPSLRVERSFEPRTDQGGLPPQVTAFTAGTIDQARVGRILMIAVHETEVDSQNWEPFASWLVEEVRSVQADGGALILDLRQVKRMSSRGLRALALAWQQLAPGGAMAVCGLSPTLRELFAISHYDRLFEVHDNATGAFLAISATREAD